MLILLLAAALLIPPAGQESCAAGPTLTTTLRDHAVVRNDRLTFDVWARNQAGKKIASTVTLNGKRVSAVWDDSDKTSYTLTFTEEGENTVTISASSDGGRKKQLTYQITYKPAAKGEIIGRAIWSIEVFTLGCGYLVTPVSVPVRAGETAAAELIRLLHESGLTGYYGGSVEAGFYLAYIAGGTAPGDLYNGYKKSGTAENPRDLALSPSVPDFLQAYLASDMDFYDPDDYRKNWAGYLGEFVISSGSGWMYCVNNQFPNVGFSDLYLSDGDVVRVQFTLGYGADIGGMSALGGQIPGVSNQPQAGYYAVADKDTLTARMAEALSSGRMAESRMKSAYEEALAAAVTLNVPQNTVDRAAEALEQALQASADKAGSTAKPGNTGTATGAATPGSSTAQPGSTENAGSAATPGSSTAQPGNTETATGAATPTGSTETAGSAASPSRSPDPTGAPAPTPSPSPTGQAETPLPSGTQENRETPVPSAGGSQAPVLPEDPQKPVLFLLSFLAAGILIAGLFTVIRIRIRNRKAGKEPENND